MERENTMFPEGSPSSPLVYLTYISPQRRGPSPPQPHASQANWPWSTSHWLHTRQPPPLLIFLSPKAPPTLSPEGWISIMHRTSNVGGVVDTRGPFVSAVTVCGDEPVLLSISGAAIDLVFPAWLRRTFYPRATRKKRGYRHRKQAILPLEYQLNTKYVLST